MWNEKKPWWQKPKGDPRKAVDREYAKNWCVIEMKEVRQELHNFMPTITHVYKPCAMLNQPKYFTADGAIKNSAVMENLTKQEAYECAKGLNFLDTERN
jgi:hypothetical protein